LKSFGFMPSQANISLFHYRRGSIVIFLLVYVDDIIVTSSSSAAVLALLRDLLGDFALKDLSPFTIFWASRFKDRPMAYVSHSLSIPETFFIEPV
jgi:hypothetical protein